MKQSNRRNQASINKNAEIDATSSAVYQGKNRKESRNNVNAPDNFFYTSGPAPLDISPDTSVLGDSYLARATTTKADVSSHT